MIAASALALGCSGGSSGSSGSSTGGSSGSSSSGGGSSSSSGGSGSFTPAVLDYSDRGPGTPVLEVGSPWWHLHTTYGQPLVGMNPGERGRATEVALLVNNAREDAGLSTALADPFAESAAKVHAADMGGRGITGHRSPEGWQVTERLAMVGGVGSEARAECVASAATGVFSPAQAVGYWLTIDATRRGLLAPEVTHLGAAYDEDGRTWVLVLLAR
ncbi:MAG: CAP domain-containing protein [Planctomycetota bacterium]